MPKPDERSPLPDLPEASLHTMHANASTEIERIEDLRRALLGTLNENGAKQSSILAQARQANESHSRAEKALQEARRLEGRQRIRAVIATGTESKADEDAALDAVRAEMDSAEQALQIALANKEDAEARQGDLAALKDEEKAIREQLAALAEERIEAINARDEIGEKLERGRHKDRSLN